MSLSLTQDINKLIEDLAYADRAEKVAKARKSELREQLFHVATVENEDNVLPRQTFTIPVGFLNKVGMPENIFLASRWPGWRKLESRRVNGDGEASPGGEWVEYLVEKDPAYLPWSVEAHVDGITIVAGRSVQQKAPEIDQRTLQKDMPEVFDKIMNPKVNYEVDADKLQNLITDDPSMLAKIQLHFAYPDPIAKLSPIKEVKDGD